MDRKNNNSDNIFVTWSSKFMRTGLDEMILLALLVTVFVLGCIIGIGAAYNASSPEAAKARVSECRQRCVTRGAKHFELTEGCECIWDVE